MTAFGCGSRSCGMTFRRGEAHSARFGPDGDTIVYAYGALRMLSDLYVADGLR
jgi:hypothetical protein